MDSLDAAHAAQVLSYSVFASVNTTQAPKQHRTTWAGLVAAIKAPKAYSSKAACPLLKLATFGTAATAKGSLRHDNNVSEVWGVEGDYDAEEMTPGQAAELLRAAGIRALFYTSASHGVANPPKSHGGPRWRVLAPLSGPVTPTQRADLVSLLNGALGGILAGESWVLSQTFYFGAVQGVTYEAHEVEGEPLDVVALCPGFEPIGPPVAVRAAVALLIPRRTEDADGAEVQHLADGGWLTGGQRDDGAVNVRCPRYELHGTDSGPSSTTYFLAGVGGRAEGGFECRHTSCGKPSTTEFWQATGLWALRQAQVAADFEVVPAPGGDVQVLPAFDRDKRSGKISATRGNLAQALSRDGICGLRIRKDIFQGAIMVAPAGTEQWRRLTDSDITDLCKRLESGLTGFVHIPAALIREMVDNIAEHNQFDSAQHWLDGLVWDGVSRVALFLSRYLGAADTPYTRAVSTYMLTAAAGRVKSPGIKADMVPVLAGRQGGGKSTVVAALAPSPEAFLELDLGKSDDDQAREMRGRLIVELGELKGLGSRAHEALKAFISRRVDVWVPKFKEHATEYARRSIFVGTTNSQEFLADDTGHRRWLPVEVHGHESPAAVAAAGEAVARDRDQLWAEAAELFARDGIAWQTAEALARPEHARFEVVEPWAAAISGWLQDSAFDDVPRDGAPFTTEDVLVGAVRVELRQVNDTHRKRVVKVLGALGYVGQRKMVGGVRATWWQRAQHSEFA